MDKYKKKNGLKMENFPALAMLLPLYHTLKMDKYNTKSGIKMENIIILAVILLLYHTLKMEQYCAKRGLKMENIIVLVVLLLMHHIVRPDHPAGESARHSAAARSSCWQPPLRYIPPDWPSVPDPGCSCVPPSRWR